MDFEAINSTQCEICTHGSVAEDENKLLKCYCSVKDKYYIFGQYISCDDFKKDGQKAKDVEEAKAERLKKKEKEKKKNGNHRAKSDKRSNDKS